MLCQLQVCVLAEAEGELMRVIELPEYLCAECKTPLIPVTNYMAAPGYVVMTHFSDEGCTQSRKVAMMRYRVYEVDEYLGVQKVGE